MIGMVVIERTEPLFPESQNAAWMTISHTISQCPVAFHNAYCSLSYHFPEDDSFRRIIGIRRRGGGAPRGGTWGTLH